MDVVPTVMIRFVNIVSLQELLLLGSLIVAQVQICCFGIEMLLHSHHVAWGSATIQCSKIYHTDRFCCED